MSNKTYRRRIATQPNFERTRENMAEFERAARAGKLLTDAFRIVANSASDSRQTARMSKQMSKVIKSDPLNDRGQRRPSEGNLQLLRGFEFNVDATLTKIFTVSYKATIDRATGTLKVDIPAFATKKGLRAPLKATHFSIVCAGAELNFDTEVQHNADFSTDKLVYEMVDTQAVSLSVVLTPNSTDVLFLALGVEFYQFSNNKYYPLNNGAYNAVKIIQVDAPNP
jgi:hypothetical protein